MVVPHTPQGNTEGSMLDWRTHPWLQSWLSMITHPFGL